MSEYDDYRSRFLQLLMTDCFTRPNTRYNYPCPCWEAAVDALEAFKKAVRNQEEGPETA